MLKFVPRLGQKYVWVNTTAEAEENVEAEPEEDDEEEDEEEITFLRYNEGKSPFFRVKFG